LEPLDGLSPEQRFFVAYGQSWCTNERDENKRLRATVDPHSPDLVLFAREGYCFDEGATGSVPTVPRRELRGMHGHDENLPCMAATFIAWGAGIKPRTQLGEIQNTDVAPTIARLLTLPLTGADGKVLSAALTE